MLYKIIQFPKGHTNKIPNKYFKENVFFSRLLQIFPIVTLLSI